MKKQRLVKLPDGFHRAFHIVFGNLYGEEIILFSKELNLLMDKKDIICGEDLEAIRDKIKLMKL